MFQENVKLSEHCHYRIGGVARYFFEGKNIEEVIKAVAYWRTKEAKKPIFIFGSGTNLLINDSGIDGLVLKPNIQLLRQEGTVVRVGTGVMMSDLLNFASDHGLSGLEWAGGLPGTVGGAIRGNAGAFGGETKDNIVSVKSLDISKKNSKLIERKNSECAFGYRDSIFKQHDGKEIILEASFALTSGDPATIKYATNEKIAYRASRHPMEYPNIGSMFKNVDVRTVPKRHRAALAHVVKTDPFPVVPTAYLLAESGLKGITCGGAMISPKHPNFIVNVQSASAADVRALVKLAKAAVKKKFGITLEEEIIYV